MTISTEVIHGTLNVDGTLELDQKPSLGPGRVQVVLQPASEVARRRTLTDIIDEIHRDQQARGFQGRSQEEIDSALREGEEEYERKWQALWAMLPNQSES